MNKVYAISDLHGMYGLWTKVKEYLDDSDRVYFLGDAIDRGPDGIKLMIELMNDSRVTYIMGNHEDSMLDTICEMRTGDFSAHQLWLANGGSRTIRDYFALDQDTQIDLLRKIYRLPKIETYTNSQGQLVILTHAGLTPGVSETRIRERLRMNMDMAYLWNREHFSDPWPKNHLYKNRIIVHGHTPVPYLMYYEPELKEKSNYKDLEPSALVALFYQNNHKINIDLGCSDTKRTVLLDLDTFKTIYFQEDSDDRGKN